MAKFPSWSSVSRDPLILPIPNADGVEHEYTIPPLGYLSAIRIKEVQAAAQDAADRETRRAGGDDVPEPDDVPDPLTDDEFTRLLLGSVLDRMRADNLPEIAITHAAAVAWTDATQGREVALYVWERGMDPKALTSDLADVQKTIDQAVDQAVPAGKKPAAKKAGKPPGKTAR